MNYTREELFKHSGELLELIEDVVAYYCDENSISGELSLLQSWKVLESQSNYN